MSELTSTKVSRPISWHDALQYNERDFKGDEELYPGAAGDQKKTIPFEMAAVVLSSSGHTLIFQKHLE